MRVLIVEDERRLAENIARSLRESAGYAVDCCFNGEDGLYMAENNPYDLLILDLMIPEDRRSYAAHASTHECRSIPRTYLTARDEKSQW